jgi:dTDP-4-amino-4,6-dideoxygalactose transaminase
LVAPTNHRNRLEREEQIYARDTAIPFCDLRAAHARRSSEVEEALLRVAASGRYVLGDEVERFEQEWAGYCGVDHAAGVANGTDAITLALMAAGIGPGDEVVVPAMTAPATWVAVARSGARPVGADVDADGLIDVAAASDSLGPRTAAVVAVHLFGRLAPIRELRALTDPRGLFLLEDGAHTHGAREGSMAAGSLGDAATFSFYPTKVLGALGDAGAVVSSEPGLIESVRRLRSYGQGVPAGEMPVVGLCSRMDELQAAVLRSGLARLEQTLARLRELGERYLSALERVGLDLPRPFSGGPSTAWHQFVVAHDRREELRAELRRRGIGTAVHYDPAPPQLAALGGEGAFPVASMRAARSISLPFDWWLSDEQALTVCQEVAAASRSIASRS